MVLGFYEAFEDSGDLSDYNFGFLEDIFRCGKGKYSVYSFLHGFCFEFAVRLHREYGYPLRVIRSPYSFIHAYCVDEEQQHYIDARGITDNWGMFIEEYRSDFLDDSEVLEFDDEEQMYNELFPDEDAPLLEEAIAAAGEVIREYDYYTFY